MFSYLKAEEKKKKAEHKGAWRSQKKKAQIQVLAVRTKTFSQWLSASPDAKWIGSIL